MKKPTMYSNDDVRHLCFPSTDRTITFPHHRHRTLISVTYCNAREPLLVMSTRRHSRSAYRTSVFSLSLSLSLSPVPSEQPTDVYARPVSSHEALVWWLPVVDTGTGLQQYIEGYQVLNPSNETQMYGITH